MSDRRKIIALAVAWATLIVANLLTARSVSALVTVVEADVQETSQRVCGAWQAQYLVVNELAFVVLDDEAANRLREKFAADFRANCGQYEQTFPGEQQP